MEQLILLVQEHPKEFILAGIYVLGTEVFPFIDKLKFNGWVQMITEIGKAIANYNPTRPK